MAERASQDVNNVTVKGKGGDTGNLQSIQQRLRESMLLYLQVLTHNHYSVELESSLLGPPLGRMYRRPQETKAMCRINNLTYSQLSNYTKGVHSGHVASLYKTNWTLKDKVKTLKAFPRNRGNSGPAAGQRRR